LIEEERIPAARQRDAASSHGDVHRELPESRVVVLPVGVVAQAQEAGAVGTAIISSMGEREAAGLEERTE